MKYVWSIIIFLTVVLAAPLNSFADNNNLSANAQLENKLKVRGSIIFRCDVESDYMKENYGHTFIKEEPNGKYITNLFGLNAEILIKNSKGEIIGLANTKADGSFEADVPLGEFFSLSFIFLKETHTKNFTKDTAMPLNFDFGLIGSDLF